MSQKAIMSLFISLFILMKKVQFAFQMKQTAILSSLLTQTHLTNVSIRETKAALYT